MPRYEGITTPYTCRYCGESIPRMASDPSISVPAQLHIDTHTPQQWEDFWAANDTGLPDGEKRRYFLADVQIPPPLEETEILRASGFEKDKDGNLIQTSNKS